MKFLKKLKSGNFWVSIISAGVLIAEGVFGFEIRTEYLNQILLGLMGILTLFGIVSDHGEKEAILTNASTNLDETETGEAHKKEESVSNVKSICDTISLLLNKVSISTKEEDETLETLFDRGVETYGKNEENFSKKIEEETVEEEIEKVDLQEKPEEVTEEVKEIETQNEISIIN